MTKSRQKFIEMIASLSPVFEKYAPHIVDMFEDVEKVVSDIKSGNFETIEGDKCIFSGLHPVNLTEEEDLMVQFFTAWIMNIELNECFAHVDEFTMLLRGYEVKPTEFKCRREGAKKWKSYKSTGEFYTKFVYPTLFHQK